MYRSERMHGFVRRYAECPTWAAQVYLSGALWVQLSLYTCVRGFHEHDHETPIRKIAPKAMFMQCNVPIIEDRPSPQGRVDLRGNCST